MRLVDLAIDLPVVTRSSRAADAVRIIADQDLIGLVVADENGVPRAVISAIDIVRLMLPRYIRDDLSLANVVGETGVRDLWDELGDRTIGDVLDDDDVEARDILELRPNTTLVEAAARMVDRGTQICRVAGKTDDRGFVTLPGLLDAIVSAVDDEGGRR